MLLSFFVVSFFPPLRIHMFNYYLFSSLSSPYVVKYYGSYFKNTDLWIVMEYCGAGSVSDIIRLRNKTVSFLQNCVTFTNIKLWIKIRSLNKREMRQGFVWCQEMYFGLDCAVALAMYVFIFPWCVIVSSKKCIIKCEGPVSFMKITAVWKAKLYDFFHLTACQHKAI